MMLNELDMNKGGSARYIISDGTSNSLCIILILVMNPQNAIFAYFDHKILDYSWVMYHIRIFT